MIINFVGPKEPDLTFKKQLAEYFDCPVFSFADLTENLFTSLNDVYGIDKELTSETKGIIKFAIRDNLTNAVPTLYTDWMMKQLIDNVFRKHENSPKKLQAIILDIETSWEYRVFKTFMMNSKFKKTNKFILIENENLIDKSYNKNYKEYLNWEVDHVISSEDFDERRDVYDLLKSWYMEGKQLIC